MLIIFERILWVFAICAIVLFGSVYFIFGGPSMVPAIERRAVRVSEKDFKLTKAEKKLIEERAAKAETDDPKKKGNKRNKKRAKTERYVANQQLYDAVSNPTRARAELDKLKSDVVNLKDGRQGLKIYDFGNTIASKIGFKENDVITTVAGQTLDFESLKGMDFGTISAGSEAYGLYNQFREAAESGQPIDVNIQRNGSPMTILVRFEDLRK